MSVISEMRKLLGESELDLSKLKLSGKLLKPTEYPETITAPQGMYTPEQIGGASSVAGAYSRILNHENEMAEPNAPREMGKDGPVSIYSLGKRK